jgi:hypothetical protein
MGLAENPVWVGDTLVLGELLGMAPSGPPDYTASERSKLKGLPGCDRTSSIRPLLLRNRVVSSSRFRSQARPQAGRREFSVNALLFKEIS